MKSIAAVLGLLCGCLLTLILLLIATKPHSVISFSDHIEWHWLVATSVGVLYGGFLSTRSTKQAIAFNVAILIIASAMLMLLMNVSIANKIVPGLWIK